MAFPESRALVKLTVFGLCAAPAASLGVDLADGTLAANPMPEVIRATGIWSLRLLVLGLALSPLAGMIGNDAIVACRRMIGLFAAFYAAVHLVAWARYYGYDWPFLIEESFARQYLTVGLIGAALLVPLALTSPQRMHAALGPAAWRRLHALIYPTVIAAYAHYVMARRFDWREMAALGAAIALLLGSRLWRALARPADGRPPAGG